MVAIDSSRDDLLSPHAKVLLPEHYLRPGETPQEGFARAAVAWSGGDNGLAQRLYDAASLGWMMFASPVLSNTPDVSRALPISCFLNAPDDSISGLNDHTVETRWLAVMGGGVGGHWSSVRSVSDIAPGPIPFIKTMDSDMGAYLQGKVRRGSYAAYLDISHPDIEEFIKLRTATGDEKRKCLGAGFHHGVNLTDAFMIAVMRDEEWPLIDPHKGEERAPSGNGGRRLKARYLWELLLDTRYRTGEPYLCFIDTANRHLPMPLREKGLRIRGSNLCSEIMLPTAPDRTAVCCLSSLNLEKYEEWKDTSLVADMLTMLDNVLTSFIENSPPALWRAKVSAEDERSVGLGYMGWHAYLQQKDIAFESEEAVALGAKIAETIYSQAQEHSIKLGTERGEAPAMRGTGHRFAHKIAVAPNSNSAVLAMTSASIEVSPGNAYVHRTRVGSHLIKNRYMEMLLDSKNQNTAAVWQSIILSNGSVQQLNFLTPHEKRVFRTAKEVDQMWVIRHAAARQAFIDQGQSVNLYFPPRAEKNYLHRVHAAAWKAGLKAVYYLRTGKSVKTDSVGQKMERSKLVDTSEQAEFIVQPGATADECVACQG